MSFVIIGFVSVSSVATLTYYQYRKSILERSFEQLTSIRNLKKRKVEDFFGDRKRDVQLLSQSTDVCALIQNLRHNEQEGLSEESYIYKYIYSSGYYNYMVFSDTLKTVGQFHKNTAKLPDKWEVEHQILKKLRSVESRELPFLIDYTSQTTDSLFVVVGSGVYDKQQRLLGYIALDIPIDAINGIMLESISSSGFGESGESYLTDRDMYMRSASRFIPNSGLRVKVETDAVKSAFANGEGTLIANDYRGVQVLSSFCLLSIEGLNWALLSEIDLREVMKPVSNLRNQLLFLSIVLMVCVFILGWVVSVRIAKPIKRIKDAALRVSSGDFPMVEAETNNVEINELLRTFNHMSSQLKEKKEQLQSEQKKQLSAMFDGQESERKRLSYDLHDGLGQTLVALKYRIESLQKKREDALPQVLKELEQNVGDAIEEVRQMSFNLMPAILSEFGLMPALQGMCVKLEKQTGISIVFESDGVFDALNEQQKNYVFRISQEILNNAVKHSSANLISLQLIEFPDFYSIIAEDNGRGFNYNPDEPLQGNGLYSIKDRTAILNGRFLLQSEEGAGTVIRIVIPK